MSAFKVGQTIIALRESEQRNHNGDLCGGKTSLTAGKQYEVLSCSGQYVDVINDLSNKEAFFTGRFTAFEAPKTPRTKKAAPAETGQEISTEFEIRWHAPRVSPSRLTSGRVLTRRLSQREAEEFITHNGGNYADGEFSVTEVKVFKTIKEVRRVKRVTKTVHELVDA
jgi:hypothetical protein